MRIFDPLIRRLLFFLYISISTAQYGPAPVLRNFASNSFFENEVIGAPEIQCTEDGITFSIRTKLPFRGSIYIHGQHSIPQCKQEYNGNDYNGASFAVKTGDCGMRRIRQLSPHGVNYMLIFVANFHPQFVTKIDRKFNVRCFFALADKTVSTELDVSTLPPASIEQATVLIPECEYSIRKGTVDGPVVRYVNVGDLLVHRWECRKLKNQNFGMLVRGCTVNDGTGTGVKVIDDRGCPLESPAYQRPLTYDPSLTLAFVEVSAYKMPDRDSLFIQCQIAVCNVEFGECVGVTPPNCPALNRRDFVNQAIVNPGVFPTQVISTFDHPGDILGPTLNPMSPIMNPTLNPMNPVMNPTLNPPIPPPGMLDPHEVNTFRDGYFRYPYERRKEETPTAEEADDKENQREIVPTGATQSNQTTADRISTILSTLSTMRSSSTTTTTTSTSTPTTSTAQNTRTPDRQETPLLRVFRPQAPTASPLVAGRQTEAFSRRQRDHPLESVDVVADLTFVDDNGVEERYADRNGISSSSLTNGDYTCIDRTAVISLCVAMTLTTVMSLMFVTYLFRDFYYKCWPKDEMCSDDRIPSRTTNQSTVSGSALSIDRSIDEIVEPVMTRQLGYPNYVMPTRLYARQI